MLERLCASDLMGETQIKQIGARLGDQVKRENPAKHYKIEKKIRGNIYECQNKDDNTKSAMMNLANKP